jgi:hypothetical protein
MAFTNELISSISVGAGGAANITFNSIPQTFTDLVVLTSLRSNTTDANGGVDVILRPNGSTSSFIWRNFYSVGTAYGRQATTAKMSHALANPSNSTASTFGSSKIYIPRYSGSSYKLFGSEGVTENNGTGAYMGISAGQWSSTSAITSLVFLPDVGSFIEGSIISLYGITKGSGGATIS